MIDSIINEAVQWCRGKNWLVRLPILIWFAYDLARSLHDPMYWSLCARLNLGIHELGHLVFSFFGTFITVLGGTLLECLAPVWGIFNFIRQKDFFGISFCFGWLGTVLFGVARYVGDAQSMTLPLVTLFGADSPIKHDWNYLLSRLGILQYDATVALILRCAATLTVSLCLVSGTWLLLLMIYDKPSSSNFSGPYGT